MAGDCRGRATADRNTTLHRWSIRRCRPWWSLCDGQSRHRRAARRDVGGNRGGRGSCGRCRQEGLSLGRVVAARSAATDGGALPVRRPDRSRRRVSRRARDARHGKADRRRRRERPPGRDRHHPLHGRVHRQDRGCGDRHRGRRHAHGAARAARRRRRDLAVELSAADGGLEDRTRARGRKHRGAETRRAGADELPAAGGALQPRPADRRACSTS